MIAATIDLQAWLLFFLRHALELVFGAALLIGTVLVWIRLVAKPLPMLSRTLVGASGTAVTEISGREGRVKIEDHEIRAISETRIGIGSRIRVVEVDGLVAKVALDAA